MMAMLRISMDLGLPREDYKKPPPASQETGFGSESLERRLRPRTKMADRFRRAEAAELAAGRKIATVREPEEESAGVKVTRARGVENLLDPGRVNEMGMITRDDNRALRAARQGRDLALAADLRRRGVEIVGFIERADLG